MIPPRWLRQRRRRHRETLIDATIRAGWARYHPDMRARAMHHVGMEP